MICCAARSAMLVSAASHAAIMSLDRITDSETWKAPSITDAMLSASESLKIFFARLI